MSVLKPNIFQRETWIKNKAYSLGFTSCGISKAGFLEEEAPRLEQWLQKNMHGEMSYMSNHFDKRLDPRLLVPGAKSVISLLYNYYPLEGDNVADHEPDDTPKISKYAYGDDYHDVIREKLRLFIDDIRTDIGDVSGRAFVDSAPVLDKAWAKKSGLGWIGKNANLITKSGGSFFFIAELILDLDLAPDGPIRDFCGTCTACIDACPTDAITEPYVVDGSKCISYFTIELRKEIPAEFHSKLSDWAFGCDICQDVCPWNRFSTPTQEKRFAPREELLSKTKKEWLEMTNDIFSELASGSPLERAGLDGMQRNIRAIYKSC